MIENSTQSCLRRGRVIIAAGVDTDDACGHRLVIEKGDGDGFSVVSPGDYFSGACELTDHPTCAGLLRSFSEDGLDFR